MEGELKPRHNETIIINGTGERRIVPISFTKNRRAMNNHGWRIETARPSMQELTLNKGKLAEDDQFQDLTQKEERKGPGRPKNS